MDKRTITLKLPNEIHQKLLKQIIHDGYGMKGKSKWVIESVQEFLRLDYFPELVEITEGLDHLTDVISIRAPVELFHQLDDATVMVRKEFPMLEGVRSKLIRASILQRLIGNFQQ